MQFRLTGDHPQDLAVHGLAADTVQLAEIGHCTAAAIPWTDDLTDDLKSVFIQFQQIAEKLHEFRQRENGLFWLFFSGVRRWIQQTGTAVADIVQTAVAHGAVKARGTGCEVLAG